MDFKKTLQVHYNNWFRSLSNVSAILDEYSSKISNVDRAKYVFNLLKDNPVQLFSGKFGKCAKISKQIRDLGNKNYKGLLLDVALQDYTKSIAFAPSDSHELAVAYGNRAACFIETNRYDLALIDVTRALSLSSLSEDYKKKLIKRKSECVLRLKELSEETNSNSILNTCPKLQCKSSYFSSGSFKISLATNAELGRHIVAREAISSGEIVVIEKPYSKILLPDSYYSHCTHCFKEVASLIPCASCVTAMFCSDLCAQNAESYHSVECSVVERLNYLEVGKMVMLALRIIIEATESGRKLEDLQTNLTTDIISDKYDSEDFLQIYNLVGNSDKRTSSDLFCRTFSACSVVNCLKKFTYFFKISDKMETFAAGLLLHFIQSLPCNAHEITDFCNSECVEIGAGAFATLSLLNHSCDPNVVRHSCGDVVVLRAIRMINIGDEIVDNYGYHYATHGKPERQNSLIRQYYFTCSCVACSNGWPLYKDIPPGRPNFKVPVDEVEFNKLSENFEMYLNNVLQNKVTAQSLDFLCKFLDYLDEHVDRPCQVYNNCQEAIKHALHFVPDYHRQSEQ